jgi:hypothetical protein
MKNVVVMDSKTVFRTLKKFYKGEYSIKNKSIDDCIKKDKTDILIIDPTLYSKSLIETKLNDTIEKGIEVYLLSFKSETELQKTYNLQKGVNYTKYNKKSLCMYINNIK